MEPVGAHRLAPARPRIMGSVHAAWRKLPDLLAPPHHASHHSRAGDSQGSPRRISLWGACCLPISHDGGGCSFHATTPTCSCKGSSLHHIVNTECDHGVKGRPLWQRWRSVRASIGHVDPRFGGTAVDAADRCAATPPPPHVAAVMCPGLAPAPHPTPPTPHPPPPHPTPTHLHPTPTQPHAVGGSTS